MMATAATDRSELVGVLGEIKSRVKDKLGAGAVDLPSPRFIIVGKQGCGKSRLLEALAGETFTLTSDISGSRRPTVFECRNKPSCHEPLWSVKNRKTNQWEEHSAQIVMQLVVDAHEELGDDVTVEPIYVRLESASCLDMQIVDLPGTRDRVQGSPIPEKIERMVMSFMKEKQNIILCVEEASDAHVASLPILEKCRLMDPKSERTILIRSKLDKFCMTLPSESANRCANLLGTQRGTNLATFAFSLPSNDEVGSGSRSLLDLRDEKHDDDVRIVQSRGMNAKFMPAVGFNSFQRYLELKVEQTLVEALGPVISGLRIQKETSQRLHEELKAELNLTEPSCILSTTRDCGVSFASALTHIMEGVLRLSQGRMTLEAELREFHAYHTGLGSSHFNLLPSEEFGSLDAYLEYLNTDVQIGAFDVEVNGGAQFRRLMTEVEVFLRFSSITNETSKRNVIQARGVAVNSLPWREVVVKLLSEEAYHPFQRHVLYVAERIKWFFQAQKEPIIEFMRIMEGTLAANVYSPLYPKHAKLLRQNEIIKDLIFRTYDQACERQFQQFVHLFDNLLSSTFTNPWTFLKGPTMRGSAADDFHTAALLSFDETKERVPSELKKRSETEEQLAGWLQTIPTQASEIDDAVDKIQMLVQKLYGLIRSHFCDRVEFFAESFFKLPMLSHISGDMSSVELTEDAALQGRRDYLASEIQAAQANISEIHQCVDRLHCFKIKCESRRA